MAPSKTLIALLLFLLGVCLANAQQAQTPAAPPDDQSAQAQLRPSYVLGTNDQILVRVPTAPEIGETPYRIDEAGEITLPLVGRIRAADKSVEDLEREIAEKLLDFFVNPQVYLSVVQFRSEPIFVVGAFVRPGIHALEGRRTLLDTLTSLGGLQPDASRRIKITRKLENGKIPLPSAIVDEIDQVSTVEIHLNRLMETVNPAEDMLLQAFDVLTALEREPVFINGEVLRPGAFETNEGESLSLLQALTLAGGLTPKADTKAIRVLRQISGSRRRAEISINLTDTIGGRSNDFPLLPNDILYVPKKTNFLSGLRQTTLLLAPAVVSAVLILVTR